MIAKLPWGHDGPDMPRSAGGTTGHKYDAVNKHHSQLQVGGIWGPGQPQEVTPWAASMGPHVHHRPMADFSMLFRINDHHFW